MHDVLRVDGDPTPVLARRFLAEIGFLELASSPLRCCPDIHPHPERTSMDRDVSKRDFPILAGIFFGLGLGGFFDGIVLHQILQWHHMLTSAGYPANTLDNLQFNIVWDGIFHASTYVFVATGLTILWRTARKQHIRWSGKLLPASILMGFGIFNLVEGTVDHHILRLHHVNETVPQQQWIYWDIGFLVWGALMLLGGWWLLRVSNQAADADQ
jgi:uncharacterized membrane protein